MVSSTEEQRDGAGWMFLAVVALHAVLALAASHFDISTRQDDAVYLTLGRGLLHGHYANAYEVGTPRHGLYPPGYPLLVGVSDWLAGGRFIGPVLLSILLSTTALGLTAALLRRLMDWRVALAATLALAVNPNLVSYGGAIASEATYTLLSVLVVWLLAKSRPTRTVLAAAIAAAVFAALVRAIGATLVLSTFAYLLLRRRWRPALALAVVSGAALGLWAAWLATLPPQFVGQSYVADAAYTGPPGAGSSLPMVLLGRVVKNAPEYLGLNVPFAIQFPSLPGTPIDNLLGAVVLTAALGLGMVVLLRRWRFEPIYLVVYGGLLLVWPWQSTRFLYPLLPLLMLAVMVGAARGLKAAGPRWSVGVPLVLALMLAATGATRTSAIISERVRCGMENGVPAGPCLNPDQVSFFEAVVFIRDRLPADARVVAGKPEPVFYYTGRQGMTPQHALSNGADSLGATMRANDVEYLLLGDLHAWESNQLAPALEARCADFDLVGRFGARTYLFRVRAPGAAPDPTDAACAAIGDYRRDVARTPPYEVRF